MEHSNKDKINNLELESVLNKLWYYEGSHYKKIWKNLRMFDDKWVVSDWWIGDTSTNKLFCRSGVKAWRFEWDILWIIKGALGIEVGEAFKWAEGAFNLEKVVTHPKEKKDAPKLNYGALNTLSETQIAYLSEREIERNEHTKNIFRDGWGISATINSENWIVKAIQTRAIGNVDKKARYKIEKEGDDWTGIFSYFPKPEWKVCFVVEWMTDFWTVAQFWVNVIWLVSATTGLQYLKSFHKKYKLIYIPDNDEAWLASVKALENNKMELWLYSLSSLDESLGDVNEMWILMKAMGLSWQDFLTEIWENYDRPPSNVDRALANALENRSLWRRLLWDKTFDDIVGGIIPKTIMIINWVTGSWKTTLVDWVINKMLKNEKKIAFCTNDDNTGRLLSIFLWNYFNKDWATEILPNIETYVNEFWRDRFDNIQFYDDVNDLDEYEALVKEEKIDMLIIDYIQNIAIGWKDMKEKMQGAVKWLRKIARSHNCAVVALSQSAWWEENKQVLTRNPMESIYVRSEADTFINIGKDPATKRFKIGFFKNKYGNRKRGLTEFDISWDIRTGDMKIFADDTLTWNWLI